MGISNGEPLQQVSADFPRRIVVRLSKSATSAHQARALGTSFKILKGMSLQPYVSSVEVPLDETPTPAAAKRGDGCCATTSSI